MYEGDVNGIFAQMKSSSLEDGRSQERITIVFTIEPLHANCRRRFIKV